MPPIFAIRRARRYLDQKGSPVTLCVTGGFRDSSDIAKALALGADAVALATAFPDFHRMSAVQSPVIRVYARQVLQHRTKT